MPREKVSSQIVKFVICLVNLHCCSEILTFSIASNSFRTLAKTRYVNIEKKAFLFLVIPKARKTN